MKNLLFWAAVFVYASTVAKEDPKFPVSAIPEDLKKDANVVIRKKEIVLTVLSQSKANYKVYVAITILNQNGKQYAQEVLLYNKLRKITTFKGAAYNEFGELVKRLKSSEIVDQSAYDGYSLYSDLRLKSADLSQGTYPYTIEYEYEMEYNYLYCYGDEVIIPAEKISVQNFSYKLTFPAKLSMRTKVVNIESKAKKETIGADGESWNWSFENLLPIKLEPYGYLAEEMIPQILVAPSVFEYDGYAGNMNTWEEYGKWNLLLNKDRDKLPDLTIQKVRKLTENLLTVEEKTKALYEYLQGKTRYVSISLGIGGLQPFQASIVDQVGYGDCKALSNYMVALLKAAGIKGYYTTINAGAFEASVLTDFPSHQSNHVIVAVPNAADTIWLECTSQINPFGYMGSSIAERKALMITDTGGKLVNTIKYPADRNVQNTNGKVFLEVNGNAKAKVKTTYRGLQYENGNLDNILGSHHDDQKKWLQKNLDIPTYDITSFQMTNKKDRIPSATVSTDLILNRLATVSGKRIFITPNLMNRSTFIPEKVESRKTNVVRRLGYIDTDTIQYYLPEGIYPEFLPQPVKLKSRFGEYEISFKLEQNNLLYIRKLKMNKGEFPPDSYSEFVEFFRSINKADNIKMVFLSKT